METVNTEIEVSQKRVVFYGCITPAEQEKRREKKKQVEKINAFLQARQRQPLTKADIFFDFGYDGDSLDRPALKKLMR